MMASDIKVLSWNINGLKAKLKVKDLETKIFDEYNIVLLQETKIGKINGGRNHDKDRDIVTEALSNRFALVELEDQTYRKRTDNQRETMYMTYFSSNTKGVAIIINKPHTLLKAFCEGGDYAWVHVEIDSQKYTFVSVYYRGRGPNLICNLMLKIFYSLKDGSDAFKHRPVIGGDFNTTLDPELDANKEIKRHAPLRNRLNEFMSILKMSDVFRKKHPTARKYTYTHHTGARSRLDYVFMLENDVINATSCIIDNNICLSDHFPVTLTLNYPNTDDRIASSDIQQHEE